MKKIFLFTCFLCSLILFTGCMQRDMEVKVGDYYMETEPNIPPPCIMVSDEQIVFFYDYLSSRITDGTYIVEGDILTMTTYEGKEIYVFKIEEDSLIFQESKSSVLTYVDEEHACKVLDGAKFKLGEWIPDN